METNYHFSNINLKDSVNFFENLDTSSIASCSNAEIQDLLNKISLYSKPLKYNDDHQNSFYHDEIRSLKGLIRLYFPEMKAIKEENSAIMENERLVLRLENTNILLKRCVTKIERSNLTSRILKDTKLNDLIPLAKKGIPSAQYFLGLKLINARTNYFSPTCLKWLNAAAIQKNANAIFLLAEQSNDLNKMLNHLMMVNKEGRHDVEICKYIGSIYETWQDYEPALKWYNKMPDNLAREELIDHIIDRAPWDLS